MNRRSFITGMAGILAAAAAPAVLPSGIIMPVRKLWTPSTQIVTITDYSIDFSVTNSSRWPMTVEIFREDLPEFPLIKSTISGGERLIYEHGRGWFVK